MQKFILGTVFCVALLGYWYSANITQEYKVADIKSVSPPPLVDLPTKFMDLVTFGHIGVYHTLLNIWSIQYLSMVKDVDGDVLNDILVKIRNHKIRFESFYMLSCFMVGLDFNKPERCKEFTNASLEQFPDSWRVPMMQGYISYFKLKNASEAALYYGVAASRAESPPYVGKLARKLALKSDLSEEELVKLYEDLTDSMENSGMGEFFKKMMEGDPNDKNRDNPIHEPGQTTPVNEPAKEEEAKKHE